ncbi:MAG TPA: patatin family protein [Firmicutes bacterium]|nr:patatin family protein [Bacillota bacterium]
MKLGMVLEGGAFRTIFSTGVCDAFIKADIYPDYFVGVSAGIAYGVSYLSRQYGRNLAILETYANDKRYMGVRNLLNPRNRSYFGIKFTYDTIPNELIPFDYKAFAEYQGVAEGVVTNLETGLAEYHVVDPKDREFLILQASCALPLLFPIYYIGGNPCLDGGVADPIPYERAFEVGCNRVLVILTRERSYVRGHEKAEKLVDMTYRKYPKFLDVMHRRAENYNKSRERLFELEREGKVMIFAPHDTIGFSRTERDTSKIRKLWQDGLTQAAERIDEVRGFITGK